MTASPDPAAASALTKQARGRSRLPEARAVLASGMQRRRCTVAELADELADGPAWGSALSRSALTEIMAGVRPAAEGQFRALLILDIDFRC